MIKKCTYCKEEKDICCFSQYFSKERGKIIIKSRCKECCNKIAKLADKKEKRKEYLKKYNLLNKEKIRERVNKWRNNKYATDQKYRELIIKKSSKYRRLNKNTINKKKYIKKKEKLKIDPIYRMVESIRCRIYLALKNNYQKKTAKTFDYLGCDYKKLRKHIENQFLENMNWENYGKIWDIDHIESISKSDLTKEEERYRVFNYKNLQPLDCYINRFIKRDK